MSTVADITEARKVLGMAVDNLVFAGWTDEQIRGELERDLRGARGALARLTFDEGEGQS